MTKQQSLQFRETVALFLQTRGIPEATPKPDRAGRFVPFDVDADVGDIHNLPSSWLLNVRSEHTRDLSVGLDEARQDALHDGRRFAGVSWNRPGRSADQQYVLMSLGHFADFLAETRTDA